MTCNVLRRKGCAWSSNGSVIPREFVRGKLPLGMGVETCPVAVECEHDEEFSIHPRRTYLSGSEVFDSRVQGLAKLHSLISPRRHWDTEKNKRFYPTIGGLESRYFYPPRSPSEPFPLPT